MPGPPPKPTALKILHGNPGCRPLNDQEPKPALGATPPDYVMAEPAVLVEWNRHAPRLLKLGLLTEIDDSALGMLCVLEVRLRALLKLEGMEAVPAARAILDVSKELRALWSRFGMTPADRARVKVDKPAPETKLARFIGGA